MPSPFVSSFALDPSIVFLNHGSFGAATRAVLAAQAVLRDELESDPVMFMTRRVPALLERSRSALAPFVGARERDLVFVRNATSGVYAIVSSFPFASGDEILTIDHAYPACVRGLEHVAARTGARVVVASLPLPITSEDEVVRAVLDRVTPRTRLVMLDHVTSPTGLVLPIAALVRELEPRGIAVLVDGAHGPGQVPLSLDALGASYYVGNLHKWVCAPKGVGFVHVREDRQRGLHPTIISHGYGPEGRFFEEFDWTGTDDPTAMGVVPEAIEILGSFHREGVPGVMAANRALALEARTLFAERLGIPPLAPPSMVGSMLACRITDSEIERRSPGDRDALTTLLEDVHRMRVVLFPFPTPRSRTLRISCHVHTSRDDIVRLLDVVAGAPR